MGIRSKVSIISWVNHALVGRFYKNIYLPT